MDFRQPYNRSQYISFFRNQLLPEDFDGHEEDINISFKPLHIQKIIKAGEVRSLSLNVYEIEHESESDPRVSISRDSFRFMAQYGVQKALILFISKSSKNFRLSLVTIDLKWEEGRRVEREYSNPRRYSFFLGPDTKTHTPEEYLIKQGRVKDFDDLKKRFSIEVVNKDFYREIAILFTKLAGGQRTIGREKFDEKGSLKLPSTTSDTLKKEFAVRLIGRLVFCWFLKKKRSDKGISLLPEELLSSQSVMNKSGFYHYVLEPLFFQVLNTPVDERSEKYQKPLWSQVPFLNGGLFTDSHHDFYKVDSLGVSMHLNTLIVPDSWLKDLFEVFETYNFTIDENTSVDVELSIEPEMLGRIFENLLAEINPETGETARKATGSYYTPRPIVEYMVDESLKQYLKTQLENVRAGLKPAPTNDTAISKLLSYDDWEIDLTESQKENILDALDRIKIIDPACGSGAFPMGILHKMLLILQKVDPESKNWMSRQLAKIDNKIVRKELENKLKRENWNYVHKLGIIQSSIYGVDIQPIAVEISKLRFFLSLIVDERIEDTKHNRGIIPLPNLEFKFVAANSLIGLPEFKKEENIGLFEATDEITTLKKLRDEYFTSYGDEKHRLEKEFADTQSRMFKHAVNWQTTDSQTMKLSQWNPFSDKASSWFDPEWMFGVREGFDVVIANPPYIFTRDADFSNDFKKYIAKRYFSLLTAKTLKSKANQSGKINLFALFILRGLFDCKEGGTLTYILPNNLLRTTTYDLIRKYILDNSRVEEIVDLGSGVFDNVTASTIIFRLSNNKNSSDHKTKIITNIKDLEKYEFASSDIEQNQFLKNVSYTFNLFANASINDLLTKIAKNKNELGAYCIDIIEGIVAHKHLISESPSKNAVPLIEGKTIKRYALSSINKYITWNKEEIHRTRPDYLWKAPKKIIIQRISGGSSPLTATIDMHRHKTFASVNNLLLKEEFNDKYEFILALLNSKVVNWYYANSFSNNSKLTVNISKTFLEKLPIPNINDNLNKSFITLIDQILAAKQKDPRADTSELEKKIDEMVYKLYDLTPEEIAIVEGKR